MANKKLIEVTNLKQYFPVKKSSWLQKEQYYVKANDGISIYINKGETYGLVGESGCGKSTLGRVILQLYPQTQGNTVYYGRTIYEYHPQYVERILKNLDKEMAKYNKAVEKAKADTNSINNFPADDADRLFHQIARLTGGLFYAKDLKAAGDALLDEYHAGCEVAKLAESLDVNNTASRSAYEAAEKKQADCRAKLDKMKEACRSHEDFDKAEALWDQGIDLGMLTREEGRVLRQDLQIIFQDPYSSLNPRMTVGQIISEALVAHKKFKKGSQELEDYIIDIMEKCGLDKYFIHRYPHQFSGGQRQRIGIARALALNPKFIVCDEAVSALDVSIQSQVINLLQDLKEKEDLTYLFISHDLSVVKYISDRIGVMYLGNMVESAPSERIFKNPKHPYTIALLEAIPTTEPESKELAILEGDIPSPVNPPTGCKFHTRCKHAMDICKTQCPRWREVEPEHWVACHLLDNNE